VITLDTLVRTGQRWANRDSRSSRRTCAAGGVFLGRREPNGELTKYLPHGLTDWMRKHPHLRVRFVVPMNRDGDTVELHAWYDQVLFPDASPMADPEAGGADR
jgi:hypothetical protein